MPRRTRKRQRRSTPTLPEREQERLISYLPTDAAGPTSKEAAQGKIILHPRAAPASEPKPLTRDYSYVPAELRRVLLLTAAVVVVLIILALVLR